LLFGLLDWVFNGISIGSVLLLAALGLAIVFGLMGVINMAHGEFMMIGAYTTVLVQNGFSKLNNPTLFEFYFVLAIPVAFVVTALLGLALERGVVRYLYGRPLETLLATWGVSLILQQFVRSISWSFLAGLAIFSLLFFGGGLLLRNKYRHPAGMTPAATQQQSVTLQNFTLLVLLPISVAVGVLSSQLLGQAFQLAITQPWFGAQNQNLTAPQWLRKSISFGTLQLPVARLFIIGLTILCVIGVYLFLQRSTWGLKIRAVTQNRNMSACLGIPTRKVDALSFALGSGLAGVAGCALSLLGPVGPNAGQSYIVDTFMVVVVGGVGKLIGSIVAATVIGLANYVIGSGVLVATFAGAKPIAEFFDFFATSSMAKVMIFGLIVVFLQFRPAGLFPQKGRAVDA
jgi:urea transport system permease protein